MVRRNFRNTKFKIENIWNFRKQNKNLISDQETINSKIFTDIDHFRIHQHSFADFFEFETEWEDMNPTISITDILTEQVVSYEVEFIGLPERLIPFIRAEIVHRTTTTDDATISPPDTLLELPNTTGFKKSEVIDVKDIEGNEDLKNVILSKMVFVAAGNELLPYYQTKFLVQLINPKEYL